MKRILVALDSSPRASNVLASAVDLARRTGGKLRLFRAVGLPPEIPQALATSPNGLLETLLESAKADLAARCKDLPPDLLEGQDVHVGTPWDAICAEARRCNADLVVIGSHGYGGLDRVLGTTAAKVVNHSDRSVLVVRTPL